jgi:hypothetical protein
MPESLDPTAIELLTFFLSHLQKRFIPWDLGRILRQGLFRGMQSL